MTMLAAVLLCAGAARALPDVPHLERFPTAWRTEFDDADSAFRVGIGSISTGFLHQRMDLKLLKTLDGVRVRAHWARASDHTDRAAPDVGQARSMYGDYAVLLGAGGPVFLGMALRHSYFKATERSGVIARVELDRERWVEALVIFGMNVKWIELVENIPYKDDPRLFRIVTYRYYPVEGEITARWRLAPRLRLDLVEHFFVQSFRVESLQPLLENVQFDQRWNRMRAVLAWNVADRIVVRAEGVHEYVHVSPARFWTQSWPVAPRYHRQVPWHARLRLLTESVSGATFEAGVRAGYRPSEPTDLLPMGGNEAALHGRAEAVLVPFLRTAADAWVAAATEGKKEAADGRSAGVSLSLLARPRADSRFFVRATLLSDAKGAYHVFDFGVQVLP